MNEQENLAKDVYDKLISIGMEISHTEPTRQANGRMSKPKFTYAMGGRSLSSKDFEVYLLSNGWTAGKNPFEEALIKLVLKEHTNAEIERRMEAAKASKSKGFSPTSLKAYKIDHPDVQDRRRYTRRDLVLLQFIRFVDNRLVLVQTGFPETGKGMTFEIVSSGLDFASNLRSVLKKVPAPSEWKTKQFNAKWDEAVEDAIRVVKSEAEETHEELTDEEVYDLAETKAEESRATIEKEVNKLTLFDLCNDALDRLLSDCSKRICGEEDAYEAFVAHMRAPTFPLLFCRSSRFQGWYYEQVVQVEKSFETTRIAERYSYKGDFADLINDNLPYLWGVSELSVKMPVIYTNDPSVPCFHFFDLEKAKQATGEYPAWDEFTTRLSEEETKAFKAFVWAIFDAKNRGRQCLYILDKGYSGKSAIVNAIAKAIGTELHAALSKDSLANQFAYSKVWDKRFVSIGDNKNPNLIRSQAMHAILGGDTVDVEYKGKDPFPAELMCKVFVASNVPLQIDVKARNEYTRVLPIHPDDSPETLVKRGLVAVNDDGTPKLTTTGELITIGDPNWKEALVEQFPAFLASCYPVYKEICPRGMDIMIPEKSSELLATFDDDRSALFEELLEKHFEFNKEGFLSQADMQRIFTEAVKDDQTYMEAKLNYSEWKEFLRRRYSLDSVRINTGDSRTRGYKGITRKKQADDEFDG